jgi:tetratricopeptide (TPR) repeat protein
MTKDAIFAQGLIKVKENDHFAAIELFSLVLKEDPKNANALSQRAVCYLNIQDHENSLKDINAAIEEDPTYGYYYQCRGYIKANVKDHEGAISDYEKAVELDPQDSIAYNNLAMAQEQMGWAKQAQSNFNKSDKIAGIKTAEERSKERLSKAEENSIEKKKDANEPASKSDIAKSVFTKKNSFKEFIGFIGNGFKLKKDDKG